MGKSHNKQMQLTAFGLGLSARLATFAPDRTSPMKIVEFAFIIYPSTDQARSRAFYEGVLELTNATSINDGSQIYVEY